MKVLARVMTVWLALLLLAGGYGLAEEAVEPALAPEEEEAWEETPLLLEEAPLLLEETPLLPEEEPVLLEAIGTEEPLAEPEPTGAPAIPTQEPLPEAVPEIPELPSATPEPIQTHTVCFVDGEGVTLFTRSAAHGQPVEWPAEAVAAPEGYAFAGWLAEDGSAFAFDTPIEENRTLMAAYSLLAMQDDDTEEMPLVEPSAPPVRSVSISVDTPAPLYIGDSVTLRGHLTGYEGVVTRTQWQYQEGGEWKNAPGGGGQLYVFTLTEQNAAYSWRLHATVLEERGA